ncbi:MAG: cation diffusion facilitator family transporter [Bacteroidota bacterium]
MEPLAHSPHTTQERTHHQQAIGLSLVVGLFMLGGKWYAFLITGSSAILSDAAESVVHVIAVAFAAFSVWLSHRPPDDSHPYGHDKITYFSAGVEGVLIVLAAGFIVYEAGSKLLTGIQIANLDTGTYVVLAASLINLFLGAFLVWQGKRTRSLILVANGKHVLTDSWTSFGVVAGLVLVMLTGWLPFDPLIAIAVAANIVWTGVKLVRQSVGGLMDEGNPELEHSIRSVLDEATTARGLRYHELRYRASGNSVWVEYHLLFHGQMTLEDAHRLATEIEVYLMTTLPQGVRVISHLEPEESHDAVHAAVQGK